MTGDATQSGEGIFPALFVMVLGAALLLDQLDIMALSEWIRFWPLLLIGAGVQQIMAQDHDSRERR